MRTPLLFAGAIALGAALATPAQASVVMSDGKGRVEVFPASGGKSQGILPGEELGTGTLALGKGAHASFKSDDGATLEFDGATRAKLSGGDGTGVALEKGKVSASGGGHAVRVEASTGLVASSSGKFHLALAADGSVSVGSDEGTLELSLGGAKQELAAGKSLSLDKGDALSGGAPAAEPTRPSKPAKPEVAMVDKPKPEQPEAPPPKPDVAPKPEAAPPAPAGPPKLTVKWPAAAVAPSYTLKGQVTPGAQVTVNDTAAKVSKSGSFSVKLTLAEGAGTLSVKATAADGQVASEDHPVTVAAPAPKPEVEAAPKPEKGTKTQVKQEESGWE